jgi:hypothetical protein
MLVSTPPQWISITRRWTHNHYHLDQAYACMNRRAGRTEVPSWTLDLTVVKSTEFTPNPSLAAACWRKEAAPCPGAGWKSVAWEGKRFNSAILSLFIMNIRVVRYEE